MLKDLRPKTDKDEMLDKFRSYLRKPEVGYSASTVKVYSWQLKSFFDYCNRIHRNPKTLTIEQLQTYLQSVADETRIHVRSSSAFYQACTSLELFFLKVVKRPGLAQEIPVIREGIQFRKDQV